MALTEKTEERLELLPNGVIQVRTTRVILDNGEPISRTHHRHVVDVDDDTTNESPRLKAIATVLWTTKVKAARISEKAASEVN